MLIVQGRESERGAARIASVAVLLLACVVVRGQAAPAQETAREEEATDEPLLATHAAPGAAEPAPAASFQPAYRDRAELAALLEEWERGREPALLPLDLGVSSTGEGSAELLLAYEFGAPGDVPLEARPTVFLLGALDGISVCGGEAVLAVVDELLSDPEALSPDWTFVAVPWASPAALAGVVGGADGDGRNLRPSDDDRDGRSDEDGPDDLDGDGVILQMLVEDPGGEWVRCAVDSRFLAPAGGSSAARYTLTSEGRDDDGDGRFNEDPPGGTVFDLNFPVGRIGPWDDARVGELPLSEPETRALAHLVLSRRAALVLLFQGNHGQLAAPGGVAGDELVSLADRVAFEQAAELFANTTVREQALWNPLHAARGAERRGAALDWFYAVPGALSLEIAAWGPDLQGTEPAAADEVAADGLHPRASPIDQRWGAWLDDTRGGLGFVDWHPVELEDGRRALVGGWEQRTLLNPPAELLERALEGLPAFVRALVDDMPKLSIEVLEERRDGEICRIRARVRNNGTLPSGFERAGGPTLELVGPPGVRLIAGEPRVRLSRLGGEEVSRECEWILFAGEGATFTLRAQSTWAPSVSVQIQP